MNTEFHKWKDETKDYGKETLSSEVQWENINKSIFVTEDGIEIEESDEQWEKTSLLIEITEIGRLKVAFSIMSIKQGSSNATSSNE